MSDEMEAPSAAELAGLIKVEFEGVTTPVSAEHLAAVYAVIAAQSDAMLSLYKLIFQANPHQIFSDARVEAEQALSMQADALSGALIQLARAYGKTEGKS